jgi:D-sedoheptulose 7-phosphate isomerase
MASQCSLATQIVQRLSARNHIFEAFFARESDRLAVACQQMAERFLRNGRLLAFGCGPYATDAQHVSVEFVHPVIVGKRALPALDISIQFRPWLEAILTSDDIVMGFSPPEGDPEIAAALAFAQRRSAMTFALPGPLGSYAINAETTDSFIHQELLEILYHTLWETVHVFFERKELGCDAGVAAFLYPFLGSQKQENLNLLDNVAASMRMKVAADANLRQKIVHEQSELIGNAAEAISERTDAGGKLIIFGNGGSATDANDWAIDCVSPPPGFKTIPAVSLSLEAANITAIANDVGSDLIFLRQFIAQARHGDVAIGISTSGGSPNIIKTFEEARKRNMLTIALLGNDGGEVVRRGLADFPIVVPSDYIPRIQEVQASIYHVIRETLDTLAHG